MEAVPMRKVVKKVLSVEQSEGQGARVRRSIGRRELRHLDPFLLLDEFNIKHPAGFPDHPHRGFETVTYLTKGAIRHEDSKGNAGVIQKGDLQWMTAGQGVIHSEMPATDGEVCGLQLWVNLKSTLKMVEPAYQDLQASQIPTISQDGTEVKVIAGTSMGVSSPVRTLTPAYYLIFKMDPGAKFTQALPPNWNAFVYTLSGTIGIGNFDDMVESEAHHTLVLSKGEAVKIINAADEKANFVLIAGQPLGEPVIQQGPFVMNTREEIETAYEDFSAQRNGFEKQLAVPPTGVGTCHMRK